MQRICIRNPFAAISKASLIARGLVVSVSCSTLFGNFIHHSVALAAEIASPAFDFRIVAAPHNVIENFVRSSRSREVPAESI